MTRLFLAALGLFGGLVAWLAWASTRDLREPWAPFPEECDGIQPPDPMTLPPHRLIGGRT